MIRSCRKLEIDPAFVDALAAVIGWHRDASGLLNYSGEVAASLPVLEYWLREFHKAEESSPNPLPADVYFALDRLLDNLEDETMMADATIIDGWMASVGMAVARRAR